MGGPGGFGGGLDIETQDLPSPPAGIPPNLLGKNGPFGGHGQRIHLPDGTVAYFYYEMFKPNTKIGKAMVAGGTSVTGPSKATMPPGGFPPMIMVFTRHAQILIQPPGAMRRAAALRIARALQPV